MKDFEALVNIWKVLLKTTQEDTKAIQHCERLLQELDKKKVERLEVRGEEQKRRYELLLKKIEIDIQTKTKNSASMSVEKEQAKSKVLESFLKEVNEMDGDEFVFIFSGTAHIQNIKGNRPIRLAINFQKQGVPTLYSYWRWRMNEAIPPYEGKGLLQIPIDQVMKQMLEIIKAPIHQKYKTFIFEFPYPPATKYLEIFKLYGWRVIYDIRDDWEEFQKVGQAKWYQQAHEIYTIEKADCTIAVSKQLTQKFKELTTKTIHLLPNALDSDFKVEIHQERRQKIGYVGHLTSGWFDWEALFETARILKQYEFEIIGHSIPTDLGVLPPNLTYLGPKTFEEVPRYVAQWRVGIIPFKMNLLTKAVDPIKVYEYLSMGLKVVSFDMPQIIDYPEVKIAYSVGEFIASINEAMQEEFDKERVEMFLEQNTWAKRVEWIRRWHQV